MSQNSFGIEYLYNIFKEIIFPKGSSISCTPSIASFLASKEM